MGQCMHLYPNKCVLMLVTLYQKNYSIDSMYCAVNH